MNNIDKFRANKNNISDIIGNAVIYEHIICRDGFNMSVQASASHYCTPKITGLDTYQTYEIGYPSDAENLLLPFIMTLETDDPTDCVYPQVPKEIIEEIIRRHGGLQTDLNTLVKGCIHVNASLSFEAIENFLEWSEEEGLLSERGKEFRRHLISLIYEDK